MGLMSGTADELWVAKTVTQLEESCINSLTLSPNAQAASWVRQEGD